MSTTISKINFNQPFVTGRELPYLSEVMATGRVAGDGQFSKRCQRLMEQAFGAHRIFLTTSCTTALEMAAILSEVKSGDEVILPSFTFVSSANAFVLRGARPVFVDVREDTLNMDEKAVAGLVGPRTRVIVPVHYAGVACEMDSIMELAKQSGVLVVEDAAQGVDARYRGRYLGTLGHLGSFSFHETKNLSCGEGGALLVNDPRFVERAEIIREKGTNRSKFFRGEVDKYTWVDVGSSFLPSDLLAAVLLAQLEERELIRRKRGEVVRFYREALAPLEKRGVLRLPIIPETCDTNFHLFHVLCSDGRTRDGLMAHLKSKEIMAIFHYVPLHTSPMGKAAGYRAGSLPVTESITERLLRLPLHCMLTPADLERVTREIHAFFGN